jgi:hypothetical protein
MLCGDLKHKDRELVQRATWKLQDCFISHVMSAAVTAIDDRDQNSRDWLVHVGKEFGYDRTLPWYISPSYGEAKRGDVPLHAPEAVHMWESYEKAKQAAVYDALYKGDGKAIGEFWRSIRTVPASEPDVATTFKNDVLALQNIKFFSQNHVNVPQNSQAYTVLHDLVDARANHRAGRQMPNYYKKVLASFSNLCGRDIKAIGLEIILDYRNSPDPRHALDEMMRTGVVPERCKVFDAAIRLIESGATPITLEYYWSVCIFRVLVLQCIPPRLLPKGYPFWNPYRM